MARFRWESMVMPDGRILLCRFVEHYFGVEHRYSPLVAVAVDMFGSRIKHCADVWESAKALELSKEFTRLIHCAAATGNGLSPRAQDVRAELVVSLSPVGWENIDIRKLFS